MEVRPGLAVSSVAHAVILGWGLIWFTPKPLESKPMESMAVDIVPISDITQNKAGAKAPPKPEAKPLVEKQADPKELKELVDKVTKQPEIKQASAPPPPSEEEKKEVAKPEDKPEPEPKKAETPKKPEPPKKPPEKPKEQAKAAPNKMKAAPTKQRDFDPNKIAALLDRRDPQRQEISNNQPLTNPSPGFAKGQSALLSQTEMDALKRRLYQCWNPPAGARDAGKLVVVIRVVFRRDGTLAAPPEVVAGPPSALGPAVADSAKRALLSCQPFTMLSPERYDQWREMEINFDPSDMAG